MGAGSGVPTAQLYAIRWYLQAVRNKVANALAQRSGQISYDTPVTRRVSNDACADYDAVVASAPLPRARNTCPQCCNGTMTLSKESKPPVNAAPAQLLFTFAQAAQMTSLPESWLRKAVTERRIQFRKVGKHIRFSTADIDALIEQTAIAPATAPGRRSA